MVPMWFSSLTTWASSSACERMQSIAQLPDMELDAICFLSFLVDLDVPRGWVAANCRSSIGQNLAQRVCQQAVKCTVRCLPSQRVPVAPNRPAAIQACACVTRVLTCKVSYHHVSAVPGCSPFSLAAMQACQRLRCSSTCANLCQRVLLVFEFMVQVCMVSDRCAAACGRRMCRRSCRAQRRSTSARRASALRFSRPTSVSAFTECIFLHGHNQHSLCMP